MPKFMIEALAQYRMVYCVESDTLETAIKQVESLETEEVGQKWLGEIILSSREVNDKEYLQVFNELNDYLTAWTDEQKFNQIHIVSESTKSE